MISQTNLRQLKDAAAPDVVLRENGILRSSLNTSFHPAPTLPQQVEASLKRTLNVTDTALAKSQISEIFFCGLKSVEKAKELCDFAKRQDDLKASLTERTQHHGGPVKATVLLCALLASGSPQGWPLIIPVACLWLKRDIGYFMMVTYGTVHLTTLEDQTFRLMERVDQVADKFLKLTKSQTPDLLKTTSCNLAIQSTVACMQPFTDVQNVLEHLKALDTLCYVSMLQKPPYSLNAQKLRVVVKSEEWLNYHEAKMLAGDAISKFFYTASQSNLEQAESRIENLHSVAETLRLGIASYLLKTPEDFSL